MAKIRALKSFAGSVTMYKGEETDCEDKEVVRDLLAAGYIEMAEEDKTNGKTRKKGESKGN